MSKELDTTVFDKVREHQQELRVAHDIDQQFLKRVVRRADKVFALGVINETRAARAARPKDQPAARPRKPRRGFGK